MKKIFITLVILFSASYAFTAEQRYTVPLEDSPFCGPRDAPVTMIEFLDYQ
jgi:hypothetical protein